MGVVTVSDTCCEADDRIRLRQVASNPTIFSPKLSMSALICIFSINSQVSLKKEKKEEKEEEEEEEAEGNKRRKEK